MNAGWSKSRISRLGKALISASPPPVEPLHELHELLMVYDQALDGAVARIREHVNVQPTSRLKNTGTILEKLRRTGGGSLPNIQDLAGVRIVLDCDLAEQLRFARRIESIFEDAVRPPKTVDRRMEGPRGYRAVHVIATVDGRPVEIQIRTRLQHQWANLFEKFADVVGRGVRYGEPPDEWTVLLDGLALGVRAEKSQSDQSVREKILVSAIIKIFTELSEEIQACETAATFRDSPQEFGHANSPDEILSLEEMEGRKEVVLETARKLEEVIALMLRIRAACVAAMSESSAGGDDAHAAEFDREGLMEDVRRRLRGELNESSSPGEDPHGAVR